MTRKPADAAEATTKRLLAPQPSMPKEGPRVEWRPRYGEPGASSAGEARHGRIGECSHHWIIEAAMLPLSKGVCTECGEERLFRNQLSWEEIAPVRAASSLIEGNKSPNQPGRREYHPFLLPRSLYGYAGDVQSRSRSY